MNTLSKNFILKIVRLVPIQRLSCIAACLVAACITGCGSSEPETNQSQSTASDQVEKKDETSGQTQAEIVSVQNEPQNNQADSETEQPGLPGVWYGESYFDVESANEKLATLPLEDAKKLELMLNTFGSIEMAAEFRKDSVMELDMVITSADGKKFRDRSIGTWKVLESAGNMMKIQTEEYVGENKEAKQKLYLYKFIDKDSFEFVPDTVSPELYIYSPRIIFQRLKQPLDDASVAEDANQNVVR